MFSKFRESCTCETRGREQYPCNIEMIEWIFWLLASLWMGEAFAAMVNAGLFVRWTRQQESEWSGVTPAQQKPVALILPVKGFDPGDTPRFFQSIFRQDYAHFRILLTVESADDPVVPWLLEAYGIRPGAEPRTPGMTSGITGVNLIVAGPCDDCGQKVHNQLAAFEQLESGDEIIAFADADIFCGPDWLARLVEPINAGTRPVSTTYRWLIPKHPTLSNLFASVINASVATAGGHDGWNILWGGSMAIARADFDDLDVPAIFSGSLNDDLRLNKVVRRSGRRIASVGSLIMPSPIDHTWASFFEFGFRQYYQVRRFGPKIYKCALVLTAIYTLGFFSAIIALVGFGYQLAWIPIVLVAIYDQVRALFRRRIYRWLFGEEISTTLSKTAPVEHLATPIYMMIHLVLAASALFTRKICWSGIEYRAPAIDRTEVLGRKSKY